MKSILFCTASVLMLTLCSSSCESEPECPDELICSMVFASIGVEVVDVNDKPVTLTKAQVTSKHLDNPIDPLAESPPGGPYKIVDDSHMPYLKKSEGRKFKFEGWVGDEIVVSETFLLRHDCCHVKLEEGPERIVVE